MHQCFDARGMTVSASRRREYASSPRAASSHLGRDAPSSRERDHLRLRPHVQSCATQMTTSSGSSRRWRMPTAGSGWSSTTPTTLTPDRACPPWRVNRRQGAEFGPKRAPQWTLVVVCGLGGAATVSAPCGLVGPLRAWSLAMLLVGVWLGSAVAAGAAPNQHPSVLILLPGSLGCRLRRRSPPGSALYSSQSGRSG